MKRFKFRLQIALTERKKIEDSRLREWSIARRFLQALVEDLGDLEQGLADAISKGDGLAGMSGAAMGMHCAIDTFISGQKLRIVWKGQEIERAAKFTDRKRIEYVMARQKREALEKLKERKFAEYREAHHKHELKELDDIYIMSGAARRRMEAEDA